MIIYESPAVTRLLGYQPEEMVGHNALEFIHPEDVAAIMGGVDLLAAPGALRTVTLRVRHKDGRWRCVESYETNLLDHPDVRAIAVNYRDITERVEAEKAARRLAAIVESSADAIIGKDTNGIITSWNRGAENVFGYTESEMVGTSIMRLIPPDRQSDEHYIISTILRGESVEHFETQTPDQGRPADRRGRDRLADPGQRRQNHRHLESRARHHRAEDRGRRQPQTC